MQVLSCRCTSKGVATGLAGPALAGPKIWPAVNYIHDSARRDFFPADLGVRVQNYYRFIDVLARLIAKSPSMT